MLGKTGAGSAPAVGKQSQLNVATKESKANKDFSMFSVASVAASYELSDA